MDRGERRRRDENYVAWVKRVRKETRPWDDWFRNGRKSKKDRVINCPCSKKTFGRPKVASGMCKAWPRTPRRKWRLDPDWFE